MQRLRKSFVAALALAASLVLPAAQPTLAQSEVEAAAGVPGGPFATAFRVQNLDSSAAANCSYVMYNDNGSRAFGRELPPINPNDSAYIYTPAVSDFPTGTFAGVVSCDRQVAAVVNFSDPNKGDAYVGTGTPRSTLYVPSAYRNYYNYYTSIRLQNASGSAQTARIEYFAPGSSTPVAGATQNVSLPANGAATVDQANVAQLNPNVSYAARITGSGDLAATVSIYGAPGTSVANQLYAFSAFGDGSSAPIYAPVIMRNYYGYNTATTIQNIDSASGRVRLTYSNGTVRNFTIPGNSSQLVLDFQEPTLQANVLYGSKIESLDGRRLIVTVNESTPATNRATTYEGQSGGGRTLVAPIVMKNYYDYNSSITCQNVGSSSTNVRITYTGPGSSVSNKQVLTNLAPGATGLIYQPAESGIPNGFIGSATITSTASNIVCVVNQDQNLGAPASQPKDLLGAYNAIVK